MSSTAGTRAAGLQPTVKPDSTRSSDSDDGPTPDAGRKRRVLNKKPEEAREARAAEASGATTSPRSVPIPAQSPMRGAPSYQPPASPNRNLYSGSPRISSPADSQIFERDVQEAALAVPNSPAIPSHIIAENHIPPVLDASSEAITDDQLDPDAVEIVMHSAHHPAVSNSMTMSNLSTDMTSSWPEELVSVSEKDETASNYGNLDAPDVRRLSFISFADVVHSEHGDKLAGSRESIHIAGLRPLSPTNRSPSPVRSPVSSTHGIEASPPRSKSASVKGIELSAGHVARPLGSPVYAGVSTVGELTIETMSQALRKTRSGDVGGAYSQPLSPVSIEGPEGAEATRAP